MRERGRDGGGGWEGAVWEHADGSAEREEALVGQPASRPATCHPAGRPARLPAGRIQTDQLDPDRPDPEEEEKARRGKERRGKDKNKRHAAWE